LSYSQCNNGEIPAKRNWAVAVRLAGLPAHYRRIGVPEF
jgi:hypothetical protein